MQEIRYILDSQPTIHEEMLSSDGICVWIIWGDQGHHSNALEILQDAGALEIVSVANQSLWFFFNPEVTINTLAKLDLWGKQFSIGITTFAFPGRLSIGVDQVKAVDIPDEYRYLKAQASATRGYVYVHPNYGSLAASIPGLSIFEVKGLKQKGNTAWKIITTERRLPFSADQGWYAFVRPLGNPIDKQYQKGWQTLFYYLELFITQNKLKYSIADNFLIIPIDNLTILREWMRAISTTLITIKEQHSDAYWPCINVVIDKNNLNFTPELPKKVNIDWEDLSPDTPYISYKNAFVLGEEFKIQDLLYSSTNSSIDSFCTVQLKQNTEITSISVVLPEVLLPKHKPCFYCGASNHSPMLCPSKKVEPVSPQYFEELNDINLTNLNVALREIDKRIAKRGVAAYGEMIAENDTAGKILKAVFAINHVIQLPNVSRIWRITSREIESNPEETPEHLADPNNILLQRFAKCPPQDMHGFERECVQLLQQSPKNWQLQCIMGFIQMEKGDLDRAAQFWRDADGLCTITLHQAWLKYLIGRAREIQGHYIDAIEIYQHSVRLLPGWKDPLYRIQVCNLKRGLTEKVARELAESVSKNPYLFHKVILDPELIRGQNHLLSLLQRLWKEAYNKFFVERTALEALNSDIQEWFTKETNPIPEQSENVQHLLKLGEIKNYLLFLEIAKERPAIEAEITEAINNEITKLKNSYENALLKVEYIRDEMSWFALQKTFTNFNNLFNNCAKILNWAFGSNFTIPRVYKEAKAKLEILEKQVVELDKKLKVLRMVRDITLFFMLTMRTFLKLSMFFVPLGIICIFVAIFFGNQLGLGQLQNIIKTNFWSLAKVMFSITLMLSLGMASLKTTVIFEKRRRELIEKAKEFREKRQHARVEKARQFRAALENNSNLKDRKSALERTKKENAKRN